MEVRYHLSDVVRSAAIEVKSEEKKEEEEHGCPRQLVAEAYAVGFLIALFALDRWRAREGEPAAICDAVKLKSL